MKIEIPLLDVLLWILMGLLTDLVMELNMRRSKSDMKKYKDHRGWLLWTCMMFWPYCWSLVIYEQIKHWRKK